MPDFETAADILSVANAFRQSRILLTGFELGIFSALGKGAADAAEVAARIAADPRGTERLLNALVGVGLLEKTDGLFRNGAAAARWLDTASPDCLTNLDHASHLYESWASLSGAVRAGTRVQARKRDESQTGAFIEAMHRRARGTADALVARIDLGGVKRILDVGGGSGAFSMAFCRAKPDLRASVLDLPDVVDLTARYLAEAGLESRVDLIPGSFKETPFGDGYDIVFFSAIIHMNSAQENARLMRKAVDALAPGGRVIIQDYVMSEDRIEPVDGALFALNMLVNTEAGDTFTEGEIAAWLMDAGCARVERDGREARSSLMIGHKG